MKSPIHIAVAFLILTGLALESHAQTGRLEAEHAAYWEEAFGTRDWKRADVGLVVIKDTEILHVLRLDGSRDTVASFPVCAMSGTPGFKTREGDGQTPEGIYHISLLNPHSSYHLSMKINYPNAVDDRRHSRHTRAAGERWSQGGEIFIHGDCVSIGCVAMTDSVIEKLYLLVAARPASQRDIPVLIMPYDDEAGYQQLYFRADAYYEESGDIDWLLLRDHMRNMRDLWRYVRDTGSIPAARPTSAGLYRIPDSR